MSGKGVLQFSSAQARLLDGAAAPSRAILVPSWQRARDLSCAALLAGEMCLVVTGLPGTGKTLLVDTVARALRSTGWNVVALSARLPSDAEFATLTGSAAILIDDADKLSATELRTLNRLRQCSVLLAGAVGFEKRCPADSRVTLMPLPPDEVATYVALWLEKAGLSPDVITGAATAHLADVSAGIPRVVGTLLADSLKTARADGSDEIEEHHVDNAAWRQVEHRAARRLNRASSAPAAEAPAPPPAAPKSDADLVQRLSQVPFADAPAADERTGSVWSRVLGLAAFGAAVCLLTAAALLTSPHWSDWAGSARDWIAARLGPASTPQPVPPKAPVAAAPRALPDPVIAVHPAPIVATPSPPVVAKAAPVPIVPLAAPIPAQAPPDPVPSVVAETPLPSAEAIAVNPARVTPPDAAPVAALVPPVATAETLPPAVIRLLNQRGQQMIDLNDFSAARLLFGRAAEAGSVKAMLALGRSYDPQVVGSLASVAGVNPAQAAQWYRRAAALGSSDATILLQQLEQGPRE